MNVRRDHLKQAALARLESARHLLQVDGGRLQAACYLSHIAVECALKLRLLDRQRAATVEDFERKAGKDAFETFFRGRRGHSLAALAEAASLPGLLAARRRAHILEARAWNRVRHSDRPYSLRYAYETPSRPQAEEELSVAEDIVRMILEEAY